MKLSGITLLLISIFIFGSCISEEPLNSEADILKAHVNNISLKDNPIIQNNKVTFYVGKNSDCSELSPYFELTSGARITPENNTPRDFSTPQEYTVTSEDGKWTKKYTVEFLETSIKERFEFENIIQDSRNGYHIFVEYEGDKQVMEWSSGNKGFAFVMGDNPAYDYPTFQGSNNNGGYAAHLVTRDTGGFGAMMKMPLAAGNIFIGSFEINLNNPAASTKIGLPVTQQPISISGRIKYKSGDKYIENGTESNKKDQFDIYAVFYEIDEEVTTLDGTNAKTHPNLYSIAQVDNSEEHEDWYEFKVDMKNVYGKMINYSKLERGGYKFGIVCSSSLNGDKYSGASGSTLIIDQLSVTYKDN